jgi:hypothetical protein
MQMPLDPETISADLERYHAVPNRRLMMIAHTRGSTHVNEWLGDRRQMTVAMKSDEWLNPQYLAVSEALALVRVAL